MSKSKFFRTPSVFVGLPGFVALWTLVLPVPLLADSNSANVPLWQPQMGDRIAWVGDGLIEREQLFGYAETEWYLRFPSISFQQRNLGWTGDTPAGRSRTYFDPPPAGTQRLTEHLQAVQPTVLIVGFGSQLESTPRDSAAAQEERLQQTYQQFLERHAQSMPHCLLLTPLAREPRPATALLPDFTVSNRILQRRADFIRQVGQAKHWPVVDLTAWLPSATAAADCYWTSNGMHLNEAGYWFMARRLMTQLGHQPEELLVQLESVTGTHLKQTWTPRRLPLPLPISLQSHEAAQDFTTWASSWIKVHALNLPAGNWELHMNRQPVFTGPASDLQRGVVLWQTPAHVQAETVRQSVIEKNRCYLNYYRPQNTTYLFGFRKHEQGQNAKEIETLLTTVQGYEQQIEQQRQPQPIEVELILKLDQ